MGLHVGDANGRVNPVTRRMDCTTDWRRAELSGTDAITHSLTVLCCVLVWCGLDFGPTVNRTARIADAAHGGQIVCTQEVIDAYNKLKSENKLADDSKRSASAAALAGITSPTTAAAAATATTTTTTSTPLDNKSTPIKPAAGSAIIPATPKDGKTTEIVAQLKALTLPNLDLETDIKSLDIKSLGDQNYKGLTGPVKVYQILSQDLSARTFPPLRAGKKDEPPQKS